MFKEFLVRLYRQIDSASLGFVAPIDALTQAGFASESTKRREMEITNGKRDEFPMKNRVSDDNGIMIFTRVARIYKSVLCYTWARDFLQDDFT